MPTIPNTLAAVTTFANQYRHVRLKATWAGSWLYTPYLTPLRSHDECANGGGGGMGAADLVYELGSIKREEATSFTSHLPLDLRNYYVQILMQNEGEPPQATWHGIIADDQWDLDRQTTASGRQFLSCFGLGFLLSRIELQGSYVLQGGTVQQIGRTVAFNERRSNSRGLGRSLLGNASTTETASGGVYAFERNGEVWSDLDVLRHLLHYYGPSSPRFVVAGQTGPLDANYQVWDFEGMTLWAAINKIIDRRRGLCFSVDTNGSGNVVLRVASVADTAFGFGGQQLPANDRPVFFSFPTTHPYTHLVDRVSLRFTALNQYDEIEVRAVEPIKVCGTFQYFLGTLVDAWSDTDKTAYDAGALTTPDDSEEHARYRATDRFADVYRSFRVPPSWNWTVNGGVNAALTPRDDGTVSSSVATFFNSGHRFYPETPLLMNVDYSTSPPTDRNPATAEPDYRPIFGVIHDLDDGFYHEATDRYHQLDALSAIDDIGADVSIQTMQHEMGVRLSCHPNHYLAVGRMNTALVTTWPLPEFDYGDIEVTAFFGTDQHQRIRMTGLQTVGADVTRTLRIEVPNAEYWYLVPSTIVGVSDAGQPMLSHADNAVLRDDIQKLRITAAYAAAWYGVPRQACTIPVKRLGVYAPLGAMLLEIGDAWTRDPVRTVVSARTMDYVRGTTTIETGWGNLEMPMPVSSMAVSG